MAPNVGLSGESAAQTCVRSADWLDTAGCARLSPAGPRPARARTPSHTLLQFGTQKNHIRKETFLCQWASMAALRYPEDLSAARSVISYLTFIVSNDSFAIIYKERVQDCSFIFRYKRLCRFYFQLEGRWKICFFATFQYTRTSKEAGSKRFCLFSYIISPPAVYGTYYHVFFYLRTSLLVI